jgi:hypothetical protein
MKAKLADEVDDIVSGIVLLRIPNESAWTFYLEGQDCQSLGELVCINYSHSSNACDVKTNTIFPCYGLS